MRGGWWWRQAHLTTPSHLRIRKSERRRTYAWRLFVRGRVSGVLTIVLAASAAANLRRQLVDRAKARARLSADLLGVSKPTSCCICVRRLDDASAEVHAAGHGAAKALVFAAAAEAVVG